MGLVDSVTELRTQWLNPSDVSAVLMIIGGDVVRTALAQATGTLLTPVCFSFGWVSYSFICLIGVLGDGRLLPEPDYPVKVFNLNSGYMRENKNWVLGRILRDKIAVGSRKSEHDDGIRIAIFEACERPRQDSWTTFSYGWLHIFGIFFIISQFAVASIPIILHRDWTVMLITGTGMLLVLFHGALPQWTAEKLPNRQHADFTFALTSGNGSQDIMVIIGKGNCLNLEELAVGDTPRNGRPWQKFSKVFALPFNGSDGKPKLRRTGSMLKKSKDVFGLPLGFIFTLVNVTIQSVLSLMLLVTVASVKSNTWYLLAVGTIGIFQNGILAAIERPSASRNLPLSHVVTIERRKVMDGLMDLHCTLRELNQDFDKKIRWGQSLRDEFFPGELKDKEKEWWAGNVWPYDKERYDEAGTRGYAGSVVQGPSLEELDRQSKPDPTSKFGAKPSARTADKNKLRPAIVDPLRSKTEQNTGRTVNWSAEVIAEKPSTSTQSRHPEMDQDIESAPSRTNLGKEESESIRDLYHRLTPNWD